MGDPGMSFGATYKLDADESAVLAALNRIEGGGATSAARLGKIFSESFAEIGKGFAPIGQALEKVGAGTTRVTIKVKAMETAFAESSKASKSFSDKFYAEIDRMIPSVERLALSLTMSLGSALVHVTREALAFSVEFEKQLAQVSTILERDQMPHMASVRDQLVEIFATGVTDLKDLTGALYTTISYGITNVQQALDVVREAERGAIGGVSKVEVAAQGIVAVMNSWGKETYKVAQVNDILFQTIKRAATNFPLLSANIGKVSAVAAQAGMTLQETMAAFSSLTKAGLNTQLAFTYLKNVIAALLKPGRQAQETFLSLGIEFGQAAIKSKGLVGIMQEVSEATGGNADVIARMFPNLRAMQGAMVLAGGGLKNFQEDLGYMKNSSGAAEEAFQKMSATIWAQSKIMVNTLKTLGLAFGQELGGSLGDLFGRVATWVKDNREVLAGWAAAIGSAIGKLVEVAATVASAIWTILYPVRALVSAFGAAYAKLFGAGEKSKAQLQETGDAGSVAGKAISSSMNVAGDSIMRAASNAKQLNATLRETSQQQIARIIEEKKQQLARMQDVVVATNVLTESQQKLGYKGLAIARQQADEVIRASGLVQTKTQETLKASKTYDAYLGHKKAYTVYTVGTEKVEVTRSLAEYRKIAKSQAAILQREIAESQKQLDAQRLSAAKVTAARLQTEVMDKNQKSWAKYNMTLKNLDYLRNLNPKAYAEAARNARIILDRELMRATKKPARDPWADELGKSIEQAAIAAIKAEEKAYKEANKRNKASLFSASGMVAPDTIAKEAEAGAKSMQREDKAASTISAAMSKAQKGQASYFDLVFGSKAELEKKFGEHLAIFGMGIEQMKAHTLRFYSPDMISYISAWWGTLTNTGRKGAEMMAGAIQSTMSLLITTLSNAWVDLWAGMVAGTQDSKQPMAAAVWDVVSQIAAIFMGLAFALIPLLLAQYNYAGAALALIAGLALGILAGAAKGEANRIRESSGGSASMNQGRANVGSASIDNTRTPDRSSEPRVLNIYYGTVVPAGREQIREFAEATAKALNSSVNDNVRLKGELVEQKMRG